MTKKQVADQKARNEKRDAMFAEALDQLKEQVLLVLCDEATRDEPLGKMSSVLECANRITDNARIVLRTYDKW